MQHMRGTELRRCGFSSSFSYLLIYSDSRKKNELRAFCGICGGKLISSGLPVNEEIQEA